MQKSEAIWAVPQANDHGPQAIYCFSGPETTSVRWIETLEFWSSPGHFFANVIQYKERTWCHASISDYVMASPDLLRKNPC